LGFPIVFAKSGEHADVPYSIPVLRARRERPGWTRRRQARDDLGFSLDQRCLVACGGAAT
jgi:hypothetical protein